MNENTISLGIFLILLHLIGSCIQEYAEILYMRLVLRVHLHNFIPNKWVLYFLKLPSVLLFTTFTVKAFQGLFRSYTQYHLHFQGTIAFGSLIIAVIQLARSILSYVESKLKAFNNDLTKCLLCLCKCCLWCLEKFMRFINRNAYIVCAIKSTNFCSSAKTAFNL